jgi:O-antigen ligase
MILYYLLVLTLPMVAHPLLELTFGGITVEKYLGLACLLFAICTIPIRGTFPNFFKTPQIKTFVVLYLLLGYSYFTKGVVIAPIEAYLIYTSHFVFLITTLLLVDNLNRLRWACLAAVGSVGIAALYVLREWQRGSAMYGEGYRPGYVTGDPNYYTATVILCLPVAIQFAQEKQRPAWQKVFCLGVLVVALGGVMLASSRGGFLGMVTGAVVYIWKSPKRLRNFVLIASVVTIFVLVAPSSPLDRLLNPGRSDIEGEQLRLGLWQGGLAMVRENPLWGIGLGTFKERIPQYAPPGFDIQFLAHNTYLEIAAEAGIPAMLAFTGLFVFTWVNLAQTRRAAKKSGAVFLYQLAGSIQAGTAGFAVAVFFISAQFLKMFWFMLFISACLARIKDSVATVSSSEPAALEPAPNSYLAAKH